MIQGIYTYKGLPFIKVKFADMAKALSLVFRGELPMGFVLAYTQQGLNLDQMVGHQDSNMILDVSQQVWVLMLISGSQIVF